MNVPSGAKSTGWCSENVQAIRRRCCAIFWSRPKFRNRIGVRIEASVSSPDRTSMFVGKTALWSRWSRSRLTCWMTSSVSSSSRDSPGARVPGTGGNRA